MQSSQSRFLEDVVNGSQAAIPRTYALHAGARLGTNAMAAQYLSTVRPRTTIKAAPPIAVIAASLTSDRRRAPAQASDLKRGFSTRARANCRLSAALSSVNPSSAVLSMSTRSIRSSCYGASVRLRWRCRRASPSPIQAWGQACASACPLSNGATGASIAERCGRFPRLPFSSTAPIAWLTSSSEQSARSISVFTTGVQLEDLFEVVVGADD